MVCTVVMRTLEARATATISRATFETNNRLKNIIHRTFSSAKRNQLRYDLGNYVHTHGHADHEASQRVSDPVSAEINTGEHRRQWNQKPAIASRHRVDHARNHSSLKTDRHNWPTWALSPEGKEGLDTSLRRGTTRSTVAASSGRARPNRYFIGSVSTTVTRLQCIQTNSHTSTNPSTTQLQNRWKEISAQQESEEHVSRKESRVKTPPIPLYETVAFYSLNYYPHSSPVQFTTHFFVKKRHFMK